MKSWTRALNILPDQISCNAPALLPFGGHQTDSHRLGQPSLILSALKHEVTLRTRHHPSPFDCVTFTPQSIHGDLKSSPRHDNITFKSD